VTGLAVANDYLLASVSGSGAPYLQAWSIVNRNAPTALGALANPNGYQGNGVDVQGRYAYVGTTGGLCVVSFVLGTLTLEGCDTSREAFQVFAGAGTVSNGQYLANVYAVTNGGSGTLAVTDGAYTYNTTANQLTPLSTAFPQVATPGALMREGPYLYQLDGSTAGQKYPPPFLGYDVSGTPLIAGSYTDLQTPLGALVPLAGPLALVPDSTYGLVLIRLY
jgi:hypothetical protein